MEEKYRIPSLEIAVFDTTRYSILKDANNLPYAIQSGGSCINWTELDYHTNWNSIMRVAKKIIDSEQSSFNVWVLYVCDALRTADIQEVYLAVADFVINSKQPAAV